MSGTLKSGDRNVKKLHAPIFPSTTTESINLMAHFHRAEIARMAGWRDRLDRTTNWAITVVAAMLSFSLSTPTAHHEVLLAAMLLVLILLVIESRRYRFYDVFRRRVRTLERHYYAEIFSRHEHLDESDWAQQLSDDLVSPRFRISTKDSLSRRMRRNYFWMLLILLVAWIIKTSSSLQTPGGHTDFIHTAHEWLDNASIGAAPGWLILGWVVAFYIWVISVAIRPYESDEFSSDDVHV